MTHKYLKCFLLFFLSDSCLQSSSVESPYNIEVPGDCGYLFEMVDGVIQITACKRTTDGKATVSEKAEPVEHPHPNLQEFFGDQNILLALSTHGPM